MADRPILFSPPMVRALLSGRKTQTRRLLTRARVFATPESPAFTLTGEHMERALQNADRFRHLPGNGWFWEADAFEWQAPAERTGWMAHIGNAVGDRLWVKETWLTTPAYDDLPPGEMGGEEPLLYLADHAKANWPTACGAQRGRTRVSIHMPRWASRLTLTVNDVRIERLNDISEEDAIAEGLEWVAPGMWSVDRTLPIIGHDPIHVYAQLWDHINGPGAWEANPWVTVTGFDRQQGNIDG
jgi:hypothetical protein